MALWDKIYQMDEVRRFMERHYEQKFQYALRYTFAKWIEDSLMSVSDVPETDPVFKEVAKEFVQGLKIEIQKKYSTDAERIFATIDQYSAEDYYKHLRIGIAKEFQFIHAQENSRPPNTNPIHNQILEFVHSLPLIATKERELKLVCEEVQNRFNAYKMLQMNGTNPTELQQEVQDITIRHGEMISFKDILTNDIRGFVERYENVQHSVINIELKNWQRSQALGGNGQPYEENLDEIQSWIERLVEIVRSIQTLITAMLGYYQQYNIQLGDKSILTTLAARIMQQQEKLIISSFIVEKQPPQVMKTNTRFAANVRWLIGAQLGISMTNPQVECVILSEAQAQRHFAQQVMNDCPPHASGEIVNNSSSMELQPQTKHFSASFRNMQLKKIKRAEKKGTESVMDEKFALLFYTTTSYGNEYRIRAWTLSLPVVVTVHGNQEPQSWATITWDNAFAEITREPFVVPDSVPWSHLSLALNTKFQSQTKRALTNENMKFLCEKIIRNSSALDESKQYISWAQFCKEPLPERTFTFWEWFFAIMRLTKDHLLGPWQAGHIVGFINKKDTMEQMRQCPEGTFLLRFSDSELGGITIAWVSEGEVLMLQPWTAKDMIVRGLADRINDLKQLSFLYPSINKDEAFRAFYSPPACDPRPNGYVTTKIKACVPGYPECPSSAPNTPQHLASPNPGMDGIMDSMELYENWSQVEPILYKFVE